ncbi:MAG TPA: isoleucine--tRNA ligase [Candidatus Acidoferrum sp.]|nr:isoleucine--tRNA ligase [Candidatus Acidoferrum sp.]
MRFDPLKDQFSHPSIELKILEFWDSNKVFEKSHEAALDRPQFVFYEGPPTANGRPGIHHVISRTVKDLVCRYKAMQGFRVDRKGGWDTHGLPVEIEVEKKLGLKNKSEVLDYGIDQFIAQCRESVFTYLKDWNEITWRIGYWLDLKDAYVTLTADYVESVWWILKNLFDRGLIFKGYKTIPFCPRCGTGLSSHEVAQGYDLVKDPSIYIKVKAADGDFSYLVWTTTPWTLPSNAALCMKPDADYVMVEHEGEKLVLAEALIGKVFHEDKPVLKRFKGTDFLKRKYIPLFDTFKDQADKAFFVINGDFVTLEDGTGIVHIAPGFGADDYEIGSAYGLPVFQAIESNGFFKDFAGPYAGMFIKDADPLITKDLKNAGRLFKTETYEHNYPFCWRCDSPLIYIARQSWYIKTTQFREQLIKNNNAINWVPDEIRTGRMLDWLENNVDWALSRERFWGTPLPIWVCDDEKCGKMRAIGSLDEIVDHMVESKNGNGTVTKAILQEELKKHRAAASVDRTNAAWGVGPSGYVTTVMHKPLIDGVKLACECGGSMTRVPELIDVWFDSGAMPYAQWHYPFENKEQFATKYPADFISEAVDQTRGWFYSLLAISTMLFDKPPFKNVIVLEFILDKEGKKMSKHKGNVVDPFATVDKYGADPLRWYLISTSNPWLPTKFDEDGLTDVVRKHFDTLRNTYSFFALYANIDDIVDRAEADGVTIDKFLETRAGEPDRFDRWIMSRYNSLAADMTENFDKYEITRPVRQIQSFVIDDLSNWYVRNNRRRFWAKGDDPSKMRAYLTLYRVLEGVCRLSAPVAPFISELLWKELVGAKREKHGLPLSVHMMPFPKPDSALIDKPLEEAMETVRSIVSLGRAVRARKNLKVRQPLARLLVGLPGKHDLERLKEYFEIIEDELNIKEVVAAADLDQYVSYSAKLNFKIAGPKLGSHVKAAQAFVNALESEQAKQFAQTGKLTFASDGETITLTTEEVDVHKHEREGYAVEADGGVTVALVTELTPELIDEGFAREMVNKIQNMRKSSGFEVTDRITIRVATSERLQAAVTRYNEFIRKETLADSLELIQAGAVDGGTEWNINGEKAAIAVAKQ